jgi:hypothetical protein
MLINNYFLTNTRTLRNISFKTDLNEKKFCINFFCPRGTLNKPTVEPRL